MAVALQDCQNFHVRNHQSSVVDGGVLTPKSLARALAPFESMHSANSVSCSFNHFGNTLIPEAVFRGEHQEDYLDFNLSEPKKGKPFSDELTLIEARNVYTLPDFSDAVSTLFSQCRFFHESSIEIELAMRLSRLEAEDGVFIFFGKSFFRVVIILDGQLQLANTFTYSTEMDVAYYVLYVFDQLKINHADITTYATGQIDEGGAIINLLRDYIGTVKIMSTCGLADLNYSPQKPAQAQRVFTLLHQVLCAL